MEIEVKTIEEEPRTITVPILVEQEDPRIITVTMTEPSPRGCDCP